MPLAEIVWNIFKTIFYLTASFFTPSMGEVGGRAMAALLLVTFFFLSGVFRRSRRVAGLLLAVSIALVALSVVINDYFLPWGG